MREKLIEILRRTRHEYRRYIGMKDMEKRMAKNEEEFHAIDDSIVGEIPFCADYLIANGVTVQQWIPVSERLPFAEYGESKDVLAVTDLGVLRVLYFDGGNWCFQNGECCTHKITHWMPLPSVEGLK